MTDVVAKESSVVAVYSLHSDAENAINQLKKADFNIKKLAILGQGYHTEDQVVGYYTTGDRMKHWGKKGAFWGGIWGLLVGSAFFLIPGVGPVMVAGSAVAWIVGALESAAVVGGLSALGAGLYSIGISKEKALKYESSVKAGKYLLVAHGTPQEVETARSILANTGAEEIGVHSPDQSVAAARGDRHSFKLAKNRVSDNVGGVKQFSSTLQHALREERHFALIEEVPFQPRARIVIVSGQELGPASCCSKTTNICTLFVHFGAFSLQGVYSMTYRQSTVIRGKERCHYEAIGIALSRSLTWSLGNVLDLHITPVLF